MISKKKIFVFILIICIGVAAYYFFNRKKEEKLNITKEKIVELKRGDIFVYVNATGIIEPNFIVEIKSKASGEIIKMPFDVGDRVKKGELLIELDPTDENRNVMRAEADLKRAEADLQIAKSNLVMEQNSYKNSILTITANLESAKISYDDAERKFQRNQELYAQKLISKEAFENSQKELVVLKARYDQALADSATIPAKFEKIKIYENNIKAAEVSVLKARLALEEARKRMNETKIFSPIDGIILSRNVSFGQIIASATSNVGGGTLLFTIADTSKMYAIADVDESDIGKISIGQSVELTVDTYRNKKFSGVIERIKPEGKTESNITIFKTRININDADKNLLLTGMTANIQIETARAENVLIAPFSAVQTRKGRHFVLAVSNDENDTRPRRIAVEPGVTDGENIEITSDELKEGDKIIAADFSARRRINQSQAGDRPRDPNRELRRMMR